MQATRTRTSSFANLGSPDSRVVSVWIDLCCRLCPFCFSSPSEVLISSMCPSLWIRGPAILLFGTGGFTGCPSLKYLTTSWATRTFAAAPRITSIALKCCLLAVETPSSISTTSYWRLKAWKAVEMIQSSVQAPTCKVKMDPSCNDSWEFIGRIAWIYSPNNNPRISGILHRCVLTCVNIDVQYIVQYMLAWSMVQGSDSINACCGLNRADSGPSHTLQAASPEQLYQPQASAAQSVMCLSSSFRRILTTWPSVLWANRNIMSMSISCLTLLSIFRWAALAIWHQPLHWWLIKHIQGVALVHHTFLFFQRLRSYFGEHILNVSSRSTIVHLQLNNHFLKEYYAYQELSKWTWFFCQGKIKMIAFNYVPQCASHAQWHDRIKWRTSMQHLLSSFPAIWLVIVQCIQRGVPPEFTNFMWSKGGEKKTHVFQHFLMFFLGSTTLRSLPNRTIEAIHGIKEAIFWAPAPPGTPKDWKIGLFEADRDIAGKLKGDMPFEAAPPLLHSLHLFS